MAMDLKTVFKQMQDIGMGEGFLHNLGLEYRRSSFDKVMSGLGAFAAGVLVGVGVGLLYAPMRGDQLRSKARENIDTFKNRMMARGAEVSGRVSQSMRSEQSAAGTPAP